MRTRSSTPLTLISVHPRSSVKMNAGKPGTLRDRDVGMECGDPPDSPEAPLPVGGCTEGAICEQW